MIDLPPVIEESIMSIDFDSFRASLNEAGPFLSIIKETWNRQTLIDIISGHIAVPDEEINKAIKENLEKRSKKGNLTDLSLVSRKDGKIELQAVTKRLGRIELIGTIEDCVHDGNRSYITYHMEERALKDQGLLSWVVSRISLSMTVKLFGDLDVADDLPVTISGNRVTVDFSERLNKSAFAQKEYKGIRIIDMFKIEKAEPHDGYIVFKTSLEIPDSLKSSLKGIFRREE